jgi:cytochrome c oxidase subunit 2
MHKALRILFLVIVVPAMGGCSGVQSALNAFGPQARHIEFLIWAFLIILTAVWFATVGALGWALIRKRQPVAEAQITKTITVAVAATAVILLVLTGLSYEAQSRLYGSSDEPAISIRVTGHQWWWEVLYENGKDQSQIFATANEIHIPVNTPIRIRLTTADVIHSFWVPSLFGKMDLINGVENEIRFTADKTGTVRGQCAEFCGYQHAHMSLFVVVDDKDKFEAWRTAQVNPATSPASLTGEQIFLHRPCATCHQVRGTPASGHIGPDLTHVASRLSIAAGMLPFSRGTLAGWILDPQSMKPAAHMPAVDLAAGEVEPLIDYLGGLK